MEHFSTRQWTRLNNASTPGSFVTSSTKKIGLPFPHAGAVVLPKSSSFFRKRITNFYWSCRLKNFLA